MNISIVRAAIGRRQRGAAAVELALLMPIMLALMTVPLFFAIYLWHYSAAQRAAQSAARYMSTISVQEMRAGNLSAAAEAVALSIVNTQVAELTLGAAPYTEVNCNKLRCNGFGSRPLPLTISVSVKMDMFDTIFGAVDAGRYGLPIAVEVELPYVGK